MASTRPRKVGPSGRMHFGTSSTPANERRGPKVLRRDLDGSSAGNIDVARRACAADLHVAFAASDLNRPRRFPDDLAIDEDTMTRSTGVGEDVPHPGGGRVGIASGWARRGLKRGWGRSSGCAGGI